MVPVGQAFLPARPNGPMADKNVCPTESLLAYILTTD